MSTTITIINLCPHDIKVSHDGEITVYPASGRVARVSSTPGEARVIPGIPVPVYGAPTWGAVTNLPAPMEGVFYIVSAMVAGRCPGRADVLCPGTGPNDGAIRDDRGQVVAVTRLNAAG